MQSIKNLDSVSLVLYLTYFVAPILSIAIVNIFILRKGYQLEKNYEKMYKQFIERDDRIIEHISKEIDRFSEFTKDVPPIPPIEPRRPNNWDSIKKVFSGPGARVEIEE